MGHDTHTQKKKSKRENQNDRMGWETHKVTHEQKEELMQHGVVGHGESIQLTTLRTLSNAHDTVWFI